MYKSIAVHRLIMLCVSDDNRCFVCCHL